MRFEGEEVKAVALGTGWVAAITSLNLLRIFTEGGLQVCHTEIEMKFLPSALEHSSYMIRSSFLLLLSMLIFES